MAPPFSSLLRLAAAMAVVLTAANATHPPLPTSMKGPPRDLGSRISLESALAIEYSVMQELAQMTGSPPVPLPSSIIKDPAHQSLARLAAAMPPVQSGAGLPDTAEMLDRIMPPKYLNSSKGRVGDLSERSGPLRIMIVGDSITQGQEGDWTWRSRLYTWLQSQNVAFTFVGPYTGTFRSTTAQTTDPQPPQPPSLTGSSSSSGGGISVDGGYASSTSQSFLSNSNHFANWGRAVATDQYLIENMVNTYPADLILVELGFNDMGWYYSDCYGTLNSMENFITQARSANPNVMFAIANVPQRTYIREDLVSNISTYNNLLPSYVSQWSQSNSPTWMVDFEGNYACGTQSCPAGMLNPAWYDGLHPNGWGEYQIANAFSKALIAGFKIGQTPLTIPAQNDPSLVRNIPAPSNFQVFSSPQGVSATWSPVYGAYSYTLQVSINGGGSGWSAGTATVNRFDSQWPQQGWTYAVSVAATCGDVTGPYTSTQSAVAEPQLPGPPNNVIVQSTSQGITVSWDPPTGAYSSGIVEYNVIFWDTNPSDCQFLGGYAVKQSPAVLTGLTPGGNYLIAPTAWNANGEGWPNVARQAFPGGGVPGTPGTPQVISNDPTSVHVSWNGVANAAGYELFLRNSSGTGPWTSVSNTTQTCNDDYFLFPGTWNYEFAVAAWNGNAESSISPPQIAPRPASTVTEGSPGPTCAPPPPWCPSSPPPGGSVGGSSGGGSSGSGGGSGSGSSISSSPPTTTTPTGSSPTTTGTYSSPPAASLTPLCSANMITPQMWKSADIGGWLNYTAANAGNVSLLDAVSAKIGGQKPYPCTLESCPNAGGCWSSDSAQCNDYPQACIALYGLVNWGNMLYTMNQDLLTTSTTLQGLAKPLVDTFWPDSDSSNSVLSTALSIASSLLSLVPEVGDFASSAIEIGNALLEGEEKNAETESSVATSDIQTGFSEAEGNMTMVLAHLLDDNLNRPQSPSYWQQSTSIVQILQDGSFADPNWSTSEQYTPSMIAAFASVPINWLWSQAGSNQMVVIQASNASLGFNPCGSSQLWNNTYAHCDQNNNIYVIQQWQYDLDFSYGASYDIAAVPGIQQLVNYNLTAAQVIAGAVASNNRGGIMAPPLTASQLVTMYANDGLSNSPLSSALDFNLPVCNLDTADPSLSHSGNAAANIKQCQSGCTSFVGNENPGDTETAAQCRSLCTWFIRMYCECSSVKGWPYSISGNQCETHNTDPNPPSRPPKRGLAGQSHM